MNLLQDEHAQIKYVGCQENPDAEETGEKCITEAGLNWNKIKKCSEGKVGLELQIAAMREQERIIGYPKHVPNLVVNEKPDEALGDRLVEDFKGTICELTNNAPEACKTTYTVVLVD